MASTADRHIVYGIPDPSWSDAREVRDTVRQMIVEEVERKGLRGTLFVWEEELGDHGAYMIGWVCTDEETEVWLRRAEEYDTTPEEIIKRVRLGIPTPPRPR